MINFWRLIFFLILANCSVWFFVFDLLSGSHDEIIFLNVGQGDASLIKLGEAAILIDSGPEAGGVVYEIDKILPFHKRRLDLAIATHPHLDHIGGFFDIFRKYNVGGFINGDFSNKNLDFIKNTAAGVDVLNISAQRGDRILYKNYILFVLWPPVECAVANNNIDDHSLVMELYKNNAPEAVFMADVSEAVEKELIRRDGNKLGAPIIKIGHHGSRTSTSKDFLRLVVPRLAVISVGKNNNYGHPHLSVLENLKMINARILRTDLDGAILIKI